MEPTPKRQYRSMDGFVARPQPIRQQRRLDSSLFERPVQISAPSEAATAAIATDLPRFSTYYSPPAEQVAVKKKKRNWTTKRKVVTTLLMILLLGFGVGSWYGERLIANLDKVFHGNIFSDAKALFSSTKLKGENQGRVNILLAGDSADDPNHSGAQLTDSIMLVSIDTKNHTGFMLSIPRDLWVNLPGWSHQKINAANEVNNFHAAGYPSGGMGQLEQVVQTDLGIPVDYYALIDYSAFRDAVNAVGGITVNINSPDPRGLYDPNIGKADGGPLKLPNGSVNLNGQTALNLARARGDPCYCGHVEYGFQASDFDRTEHQRQMLTALAQKAQSVGVLANPIKVSQLFNSIGNNVKTDLNLQDILRFIQITKGMNVTRLQSLTYSSSGSGALLTSYQAPDGEAALVPSDGIDNFGALQQYYQQLTSDNPVVREGPSVVVLNGTNINGLARQESQTLQNDGFNVVGTADAASLYPNSMVVDLSSGSKPASKQFLQSLFARGTTFTNSPTGSAEAIEAHNYNANFVVILGQDTSSTTQQP